MVNPIEERQDSICCGIPIILIIIGIILFLSGGQGAAIGLFLLFPAAIGGGLLYIIFIKGNVTK